MRHIAGIRLDAAAHHRFKPDPEEFLTELIAAANSIPEGPPVGTIARREDGAFVAVRVLTEGLEHYWAYTCTDHPLYDEDWPDPDDADSWPQIRPDEWPDQAGLDWFPPGEEPIVPRPDPTAQQEPKLCSGCYECQSPKRHHTPRVVDRLGVDERGSRWLDVFGWVWSFENGWWKTVDGGLDYGCVDPSIRGPFKEILEPRVLPSLDCEEARDGTVWEAAFSQSDHGRGWKFWYVLAEREWYTDAGHDGSSPLRTLDFLTERGPYTEVLGDPS
ncbi:Uncharacterised protein [Mycobacteroides abscessus subsp. abscessus]|nr:Uncharacterised protein [Mycobacteroides abscessus subsp. abscessus]SIL07104.1 Uncharacterised protein [Mycobacteroides abscessus subsp. abscessus]SLK58096.1 Uncharacterised protein [Mycobacteroides abscessus subsp. abscessus]